MTISRSTRSINIGVIGLGWAGQQHLAAYADLPNVNILAIAGQETDLLASLGDKFAVSHRLESWTDLLDVPGLDAVSVAVPTFLHATIAIAALERGIHVLSEKPIARNGDEGQMMVAAARKAGRVLEVAFNHRLRKDIQELARVISAGEIGRPYYARASWLRRRGIPKLGSWFTNRDKAGGGPLIDIGVHVLDYSLHLLGEPRVLSVSASTYSELGPRGLGGSERETADQGRASAFEVEDFASAFLRLEGGGTLVLESSWASYRAPEDLLDFSVLATDGGADLKVRGAKQFSPGELVIYRDSNGEIDDTTTSITTNPGHPEVVSTFVNHVLDPSTWANQDGSVALDRARIIDACYLSAAEQREVQL